MSAPGLDLLTPEEQQHAYDDLKRRCDAAWDTYYELRDDLVLADDHRTEGHESSRFACPLCW